jgi:hypothetical protein
LKSKIIFTTLGTILLGALGSGLWDLFLKNVILLIGQAILNLSILIKSGIVNDIYIYASKGDMYYMLTNISFTSSIGIVFFMLTNALIYISTFSLLFHFNKVHSEINKDTKNVQFNRKTLILDKLPSINIEKFKPFIIFELMMIIGFSMLILFSYNLAKNNYIESAISQYNYLLKTIKPYVNTEFIIETESKYAQIRNKKDYDLIINQLKSISDKNGIKTKRFITL